MKRDPREGLRPWLRRLPVPVCVIVVALLFVPAVVVAAMSGALEFGKEAASDCASTLWRLVSK